MRAWRIGWRNWRSYCAGSVYQYTLYFQSQLAFFQLCPDDQLLRQLDSSLDQGNLLSDSIFSKTLGPTASAKPQDIGKGTQQTAKKVQQVDEEEDNAHLILADNLKMLSIDPVDYRFFGKSSGAMLIQTAIELKNEYAGRDRTLKAASQVLSSRREELWHPHPVSGLGHFLKMVLTSLSLFLSGSAIRVSIILRNIRFQSLT